MPYSEASPVVNFDHTFAGQCINLIRNASVSWLSGLVDRCEGGYLRFSALAVLDNQYGRQDGRIEDFRVT